MASQNSSKSKSNTIIKIDVVAHPGKLGLVLKFVKEGAEVLRVDKDSPLTSVIFESDVIQTLNGQPLVNKNQFHTSGPRTLGIGRQIDTFLCLEAQKLAQNRDRDVPSLSTKAIPFVELQRYNSIAINSGMEYDTEYVGATPTAALCKQYACFIADEANCVKIHNVEYIMLHYDCRYGTTDMMKLMMGRKDCDQLDRGLTSFVEAIIEDRNECMRKKKPCSSMLEYLFNTIKIFYDDEIEK
jgi:hypothetical protein